MHRTDKPLYARTDIGCTEEPKKPWPPAGPNGPCQAVGGATVLRCYSGLALDKDKKHFSNQAIHPNAYCSGPHAGLMGVLSSAPECKPKV